MPIRTSAPEVCAVIDTSLTGPEVFPFIKTASLIIDEHLASETPAITPALLQEIETFLAAHILTLQDPRAKKEEAGGTKFEYEGTTGMGLDGSKYGQMAKMLDPTGKLGELSQEKRTSFIFRAGNETDVENLP